MSPQAHRKCNECQENHVQPMYQHSLKIIMLSTCQTRKTLVTNSGKWWVHLLSIGHLKKWVWWLIHSDISPIYIFKSAHFDTNGFLRCPPWLMGLLHSTLCSLGCLHFFQGHVEKRSRLQYHGPYQFWLLQGPQIPTKQGGLWCGQPLCS